MTRRAVTDKVASGQSSGVVTIPAGGTFTLPLLVEGVNISQSGENTTGVIATFTFEPASGGVFDPRSCPANLFARISSDARVSIRVFAFRRETTWTNHGITPAGRSASGR
jgi:hypothetical protein